MHRTYVALPALAAVLAIVAGGALIIRGWAG